MAKKKIRGKCAYCGEYDKLSKDEVVPRCLFIGNLPSDIPKVSACTDCNNIVKSKNDSYLRDLLVVDRDSSQHPIAQQLWDKFARSVRGNQSALANDVQRTSCLIPLFTPGGLFAEWAYGFEMTQNRATKILSMMVRGLYYCYVGKRLPKHTQFDVYRLLDLRELEIDVRTLLQIGAQYVSVGDSQVFECIYLYSPGYPEVSLWFLCFYKRVFFSVATNCRATQRFSA